MIPLIMSYKLDYEISPTQLLTNTKEKDAYHVACAVMAECDYFVTTDDRLLKFQSEKIKLVTPGEFIRAVSETQ